MSYSITEYGRRYQIRDRYGYILKTFCRLESFDENDVKSVFVIDKDKYQVEIEKILEDIVKNTKAILEEMVSRDLLRKK